MLDFLAVVLSVGILIALGVFVIAPLMRRLVMREAQRVEAVAVDPRWFSVLERLVPGARGLTSAERTRLLKSARELLITRRWEGCGGLVLDEDMKLVIAAQACLLTLAVPGEPFPGLREILVYPAGFLARRVRDRRKSVASNTNEPPTPELGEAWTNGVVVLGWEAAREGASDPQDGQNLVLHEFAHQFANDNYLVPASISDAALFEAVSPVMRDPEKWHRVLSASYDRLCAKGSAHTVLDKYGTTDLAEFFAVATEAFFERPAELKLEDAELYAQLVALYRQDPTTRIAG
jgi:Mlc titration factor MtfA (ptsG expression regulator)